VGEHVDPARNDKPPGLLAMEIQGDRGRIALALRRSNKRFNWIYLLQLPTPQLDFSVLEFRNADYSDHGRGYLCFKLSGAAK
jgi:hypothetical protein